MERKPRRTPEFWVQATGSLVAPFHWGEEAVGGAGRAGLEVLP